MRKIFIKLFVWIMQLIYYPIKLFNVKKKITMISRQSDSPSLDFVILAENLKMIDSLVQVKILSKKIDKGFLNYAMYLFHMFVQMYHIATSKVVVIDGYCITVSILRHKKGTKIIQIWHAATAIKKFGYQTIGMDNGTDKTLAELMKMHCNYDFVLASSKLTGQYYCKAFNIDPTRLVYMGMPHYSLLNMSSDFLKEKILKKYDIKEKVNILYIPTFRKGQAIPIDELVKSIDFERYNLIAKLHPLDRCKSSLNQVIFDDEYTVYEWMQFSDIIISDYSSLIVEAAMLDKQIYLYIYDYAQYKRDPGLNVDLLEEPIGQYAFQDPKELKHLLDAAYDYNAVAAFRKKYVEVDLLHSAEQLSNFIVKVME